MDFLNQLGRGLGQGVGYMGNGLSSAYNAMPSAPQGGFDLFGLDCISLWLMNRPVRGRMQGGVGTGG